MKTKLHVYLCVLISILAAFGSNTAKAQTTLSRGDIAFVAFSGYSGTGELYFSFVTWVDIAPGTVIKFTLNQFRTLGASANASANANSNNSITVWTNTEGTAIPAGTVITLYKASGTGSDLATRGSQTFLAGSAGAGGSTTLVNMGTIGRALFAYQGSDYSATGTSVTFNGNILFGLCYQGVSAPQGSNAWLASGGTATATKSFLPSELAASSSYNLNNLGANVTAAQYTGARTGAASLAGWRSCANNG